MGKTTRDVCVIGVGMTEFRHRADSIVKIGVDAIQDALNDIPKLKLSDIQAVCCGSMGGGPMLGQRIMARTKDMIGQEGLTGVPITNWENMCTSGTCAFTAAYHDIAAGIHDIVMEVGVEKLGKGGLDFDASGKLTTTKGRGGGGGAPMAPMMFGLQARAHTQRFGTKREHLAMVSVKSREYARTNPNAQYRQQLTVDDVLNAKMTFDPLTMYMCCPTSTGGSCVILCAADIAKEFQDKPVKIDACVLKTSRGTPQLESGWDPNIRASREAYKIAGVGPEDIDVAQVHDCFAIAELMHYESMGFCELGKGGKFIEDGHPCKGGDKPINTDGGLISKGHPMGATGGAQIYELVHQLRGDGHNQVMPIPEVALQHNMGGGAGIGMAYCVNIFERGW